MACMNSALWSSKLGCRASASISHRRSGSGLRALTRQSSNSDSIPLDTCYRPSVGICVINRRGEVFVASRLDHPGAWQMPQGGIDEGESPLQAAIRELHEETNITSVELLCEGQEWLKYEFPEEIRSRFSKSFRKWKGQQQKWFLFRFLGHESEIDVVSCKDQEFSRWRWLPMNHLPSEIVKFKRDVYCDVVSEFAPHVEEHLRVQREW